MVIIPKKTGVRKLKPKLKSYLLWAVVLAQALCVLSALSIKLLGMPWRKTLGDLLFLEGALLLVAGGLLDLCRSITLAHIRGLHKSRFGEPPSPVKKPGRGYVLLIAGLLLCIQAVLLLVLFTALE